MRIVLPVQPQAACEDSAELIAAIEAGNGALNAYVLATPELALAQARESDKRLKVGDARPLEGVPLGIKDLFATRGTRTSMS